MIAILCEGPDSEIQACIEQARACGAQVSDPYPSRSTDTLHFQVGASEIEQALKVATVGFSTLSAMLTFLKTWKERTREPAQRQPITIRDPRTGDIIGVLDSNSSDADIERVLGALKK